MKKIIVILAAVLLLTSCASPETEEAKAASATTTAATSPMSTAAETTAITTTTTNTYKIESGTITVTSMCDESNTEQTTSQSERTFRETVYSITFTIENPEEFNVEEILKYPNLQELGIGYYGDELAEIKDIERLCELEFIESFSLRNVIPTNSDGKANLNFLSQLPYLSELNFFNVYLDDWSFLSSINHLETIDITEYGELSKLNNEFQTFDYTQLKNCLQLRTLYIAINSHSFDFANISEISTLNTLTIGDITPSNENSVINNFQLIVNLPKLKFLSLYNVKLPKDSDIGYLSDCEKIESVYIRNVNLDNIEWAKNLEFIRSIGIEELPTLKDLSPLKNKKSLRDLTLVKTGISDITFFDEMNDMESINIGNSRDSLIPKDQLDYLREKLPNCEVDLIYVEGEE
jgi:hypothetical protein